MSTNNSPTEHGTLENGSKAEMLRHLLAHRQHAPIYELLRQASSAGELGNAEITDGFSDSKLVRLIGSVRNHLLFICRFGDAVTHVEDETGCHHFAFPVKLEEWLALDAPGLTWQQVESEYVKFAKANEAGAA